MSPLPESASSRRDSGSFSPEPTSLVAQEPDAESRGWRRRLPGLAPAPAAAFIALAVALGAFQLYLAGIRPLGLFFERGVHLALVQILAFLLFPTRGRGAGGLRGGVAWALDLLLIAGSTGAALHLIVGLDDIVGRAGAWTTGDLVAGVVAVVTLLEATRRALGWPIVLVASLFIAYAYSGPLLPGMLRHGGYGTRRLIGQLFLGQEGIFGIPLGVAVSVVFAFILFGALMEVTGAGRFFIDLAYALTGKRRGGPAKAAVLASASLGSISGSAIANVVTSGAFTIPLMKRTGYRPEEAAGIEAAASTGGQILPPVMGAGAFLIAEYTGLPYLEVVRGALIPALLYLATVFLFVHLVAAARGLQGLTASELPRFGATLAGGWHFLLAVVVLVGALVLDLSVGRVGFVACLAVAALAAARAAWNRVVGIPGDATQQGASCDRGSRGPEPGAAGGEPLATWLAGGPWRLIDAFTLAARNALPVSLACATAGIIVAVVGLTGLGLKLSGMMLSLTQGSLLLALLLVLLASLVLGMGLPVTASYIVLIVLAGPALATELGLPVLVAHLVVFWYSQDSNVTPPVCLAAYAAAGVAGSHPLRTGLYAWKYAKGLYLVPLLMVVHPELVLGGAPLLVLVKAVVSLAALAAFAFALEGFARRPLRGFERLVLLAAAAAAFHPSLMVGGAAALLIGLYTLRGRERRAAVSSTS